MKYLEIFKMCIARFHYAVAFQQRKPPGLHRGLIFYVRITTV